MLGKHPFFQGRQHPLRPDRRFNPRPSGVCLSGLLRRLRHCRRFLFRPSVLHVSAFLRSLRSTDITPLPRYYGRSDSCPTLSTGQVSLPHLPSLPNHSAPNHLTHPQLRFDTLPLSSLSFPLPKRVWASPLNRRLADHARPYRVRYPTDWSFTSCCSPPRLSATQLQSVTGRRAYA